MKQKKIAAPAVAVVDANGVAEIHVIAAANNTYARLCPVVLRFDADRDEVIVEIQDRVWIHEDRTWEHTSRFFRFRVGDGWVTVHDKRNDVIAHLIPAKTLAQANRAVQNRFGKIEKPQLEAAA